MDKSSTIKVIIAGSRNYSNFSELCFVCDYYLSHSPKVEIVCGGARGADSLGKRYAELKGYKIKEFIPDWDKFGKSAGYRRNVEMANYADVLIAFWDGNSKGTGHMIDIMKNFNKPYRTYLYK